MPSKTIPELTANAVIGALSMVPFDSGVQTYRINAQYMAQYFQGLGRTFSHAVGSSVGCDHTTLSAAIAAASDGHTILLTESFNLTAKQTISKKLKIMAMPGVTITQTGGTVGLELDAAGITLEGIRFAGFSTAGDKAIVLLATAVYARVRDCNFAAGTDTEIEYVLVPAGKEPFLSGNMTET